MNRLATPIDSRGQRGVVLPVVMIMLLVLTIASLVIAEQIGTQTRVATNASLNEISSQAAEAVLRNVVNQMRSGTIATDPGSYPLSTSSYPANGQYKFEASSYAGVLLPWQNPKAWAATTSNTAWCGNTTVQSCKYIIEKLPNIRPPGFSSDVSVFRITSRVVGPDGQSVVMLQTLFQKH
ncbi:hypothetical protein [Dyella sp. ASV21]|jgi:Tfp pilus assembly protein PilX|uniref:pilus assembly PilX family protein n=1 Tax=Dyella sp. ASV21 TaxID=2795114 RepID=UPI0018ECC4E0|nr:hypothetical protein [Dyella sp. ASV21]